MKKKWLFLSGLLICLLGMSIFFGKKYLDFHRIYALLPDLPAIHSDPACNEKIFTDQIWIHRVNSPQRALLMSSKYKGMEMDLVYDSINNIFEVRHPPVEFSGIVLDSIFSSIPHLEDHYFWLDYKNLDSSNKERSCSALLSLTEKHNIKQNIIVESSDPESLTLFSQNGFYTSYYIPTLNIASSSKETLIAYYEEVKTHLSKSNVCALSTTYLSLPFIEKYFPDKDILLWYLADGTNLSYFATLAYLRTRKNVKVILVAEMSEGYR